MCRPRLHSPHFPHYARNPRHGRCVTAAAGVHKVKKCSRGEELAGSTQAIALVPGRTRPGAPSDRLGRNIGGGRTALTCSRGYSGPQTMPKCRINKFWRGARFARPFYYRNLGLAPAARPRREHFVFVFFVPGKPTRFCLQIGKPGLIECGGSRAFYKKKNLKRANKTTLHPNPILVRILRLVSTGFCPYKCGQDT